MGSVAVVVVVVGSTSVAEVAAAVMDSPVAIDTTLRPILRPVDSNSSSC